MSVERPNCTSCGAALPAHAPQGLCPQCLLKAGLPPSTGVLGLQLRCPECRNPIDVSDERESTTEITCPFCGSTFNLLGDTITHASDGPKSVGRFEIQDQLGVGAFGTVWKARDPELDRTVAIKIPRKERLLPEELQQFLREARSAAQLQHPNIVSVHEVGRDGDTVFIVSDYVSGVTLAEWLSAREFHFDEAARLCAQVSEALLHAHRAGVIHRDLKPSNIMMDSEGAPHVMDFGLAKREAGEVTMTVDGKVLGTPAYMSPEQASGHAHSADRRTDIYSLGVILYQLLTGSTPFRGASRMILHQTIHDEPPPPRSLNRAIPRDLETICLKCLEKDPSDRYASGLELAEDLRRYLSGEPIAARPTTIPSKAWRWLKRNRSKSVAAGIALITLMLALALYLQYQLARTQRAEALIQRLLTADTADLETILAEIEPQKQDMEPAIRRAHQLAVSRNDTHDQLRLSPVLLPEDEDVLDFVIEQFLEGDAAAMELFPLVSERLPTEREGLIQRLLGELDQNLKPPKFDDSEPPNGVSIAPAVEDRLQSAQGAITQQFAFCLQLPRDEFVSLAGQLAAAGYRPFRCRPYQGNEQDTMVAALWGRDGNTWQVSWDLNVSDLSDDFEERLTERFVPQDVAVYPSGTGELRHVALYRAIDAADGREPRAIAGATFGEFSKRVLSFADQGLRCSLLQSSENPAGQRRYTALFSATDGPTTILTDGTHQAVQQRGYLDRIAIDVCLSSASNPVSGEHRQNYDVLWEFEQPLEARLILDRPLPELRSEIETLAEAGFRAVSVSVGRSGPNSALRGCAVLHRPLVNPQQREGFDRRRANAAVALMKIGRPDAVWQHLRGSDASGLRHQIQHLVEPLQVDPSIILERLEAESDAAVRQMLLLTLGELFPEPSSVPVSVVSKIIAAHTDPHPGIHAAAEWLLSRWEQEIPDGEASSHPGNLSPEGLGWWVNEEGLTFVEFAGPIEFVMGTPANEIGRRKLAGEHLHVRRIPRSFAIGSTEVSRKLFQQFLRDTPSLTHLHDAQYVTEDLTGPQTKVSWYEAAAFCRWLSDREQIPEDQMCYPGISEINADMTLPEDYLARTGYRLPTEAEWEYACRAGTAVSRFFGEAEDLLPEYARYDDNAVGHTWPSIDRLPNEFGLFHIYGNVNEWCQDEFRYYGSNVGVLPQDRYQVIVDHEEVDRDATTEKLRVYRGGSFSMPSSFLRSGFRHRERPDASINSIGFRVARTIRSEDVPSRGATVQATTGPQRPVVDQGG